MDEDIKFEILLHFHLKSSDFILEPKGLLILGIDEDCLNKYIETDIIKSSFLLTFNMRNNSELIKFDLDFKKDLQS